ncbi:MAG: glycosyltransferase [Kiritimatiellae bacterium]|nr:glycosyltransferase [Kiritimatiellia bacterium]
MKRVLFFLKSFPALSTPFVLDQILALERNPDLRVRVVSITRPESPVMHPQVQESAACREQVVLQAPALEAHDKKGPRIRDYVLRHPLWYLANRRDPQVRDRSLLRLCVRIPAPVAADEIVVHFGDVGVIANKLRRAGRLKGRMSVFFHGYDMSRRDVWERYSGEYVRLAGAHCRLLPSTELWRRKLLERGCPEGAVAVHRMGVNPDRYGFRGPRPLGDPPVLFSVARFVEKKGLDVALKAVAVLRDRGLRLRYRIAGYGPLEPVLFALRDELGLREHVQFLGAQSIDNVLRELAAADLSVQPSRTASDGDMEGIPVSLIEAMASGVPVVSTHHSGIPELIEDGVSGFLVPEQDHVALADCLQHGLEMSAEGREPIRRAARARVETEFDARVWNQRLLESMSRA